MAKRSPKRKKAAGVSTRKKVARVSVSKKAPASQARAAAKPSKKTAVRASMKKMAPKKTAPKKTATRKAGPKKVSPAAKKKASASAPVMPKSKKASARPVVASPKPNVAVAAKVAAPKLAAPKPAAPMAKKKAPIVRRDGSGHLNPKYAKELLRQSGKAPDEGKGFLDKPRSKDDFAESLGEQFVEMATSGEDEREDVLDQEVPEERGGPFVPSTAGAEFAEGTDGSNPPGAKREPFPTT